MVRARPRLDPDQLHGAVQAPHDVQRLGQLTLRPVGSRGVAGGPGGRGLRFRPGQHNHACTGVGEGGDNLRHDRRRPAPVGVARRGAAHPDRRRGLGGGLASGPVRGAWAPGWPGSCRAGWGRARADPRRVGETGPGSRAGAAAVMGLSHTVPPVPGCACCADDIPELRICGLFSTAASELFLAPGFG
jgi:hypothetical protein